ncbi:MAG: ABC transporter permease [Candidatus Saccharimonadales bacterium]
MKKTRNKSSGRSSSNYFGTILAFTNANILRFFRDKIYIFFMFILPACFLLLFGMMYSGDSFSSFETAIFNNSKSELATTFAEALTSEDSALEKVDSPDRADAEDRLIKGELSAIIIFPENFGITSETGTPQGEIEVIYGKNSEQAGQAISSIVGAVANEINYQIVGQQPSITVKSEPLMREGLSNFDYVFAGLLGYTILTIGLMGVSNLLPGDKQSGATCRLRATTISASQLILSYALTFLLIGIISFIIMIAIGILVFDFTMRGNWLTFAAFASISTVMMLGFGLFVGGFAKNEAQASVISNLLMFPMMFLSGVFFPLFMMPEFVQTISTFIPLTPIVDGIRLIITENYSLIDVLPQLGIIAVWGVAIYALAIKTFRWE